MDKEIIYAYEGILQCNENEETTATINYMGAFYQTNMNKRRQMQILDDSIYMKFEKQARKTIVKDAYVNRW